jgi:Rrf2 family protein
MKLLTKKTDYAIRILAVLTKNKNRFLSAREISSLQNIPYQFIRQILRILLQHNFVVSKEGGKGGFKLNVDPKNISVSDVIQYFQGNIMLSKCMFRKQLCHNRSTCILKKEINRIEELVEKEFARISIAKLTKT